VNVGWDSSRCGGCLRLHPTPMGSAPTRDVDPVAGRLVLFPSATQMHEVLPATEGERLALTLWVDYADGEQKAN
jgi:predicted 2-oxoglutarate/Fe(II)-dependent dioxygenase YbiX